MSIPANFPGFVIDFVFVMCYNSVTLRAVLAFSAGTAL